ncbi:hypothetical protein OS493_040045 [Desmophyllum pertusum]|uniref:Rapamycin-insensitive companion of mTOR domain-containing protein n=1 Tax=Desmophyllum pertusum TaxID=174260 RepID=A0A9X0CW52_9CNID|nr:hypothetical protein OS493_040045 [Desmophyllum pertusum]
MFKQYNNTYVRWVEELLAESLTSYVKQPDENTFTRRTNKRLVLKDAYLPPHLYGQLVQKKNGFKLLQRSNDVELFARTLRHWSQKQENKTCFYVLGLIAKTREGADILRELEWESVRHMGEDKWPVLETSVENKEEVIPLSYHVLEPPTVHQRQRRRKIATRESGFYDDRSGVYLGEESSSGNAPAIDSELPPAPGGILERLYSDAGYSMSSSTNKGAKLSSHRRNFSEGNFTGAIFSEKNIPEMFDVKRRAVSNVDRIGSHCSPLMNILQGTYVFPNEAWTDAISQNTL